MRTMALFDPTYGIGLSIAAGSGRSWMEQPGGDPVHAHLTLDAASDSLVVVADPRELRLRAHTGFVRWEALLAFADELERLAAAPAGEVVLDATPMFQLTVRLREDGVAQAEATFGVGHHAEIEVTFRTRWNWHEGHRADLPELARQVREAVDESRPAS